MFVDQQVRITEIFYSLQGESKTVGCPTVFVRLTGCPLRCRYCDTAYAFSGGELMTVDQILGAVAKWGAHYVTVTGGEPLAQIQCLPLLTALCDQGYEVSLETSGALDVGEVDGRVVKVVDLKTPGSNEQHRNLFENIPHLTLNDQVKFVITNREDYEWSKQQVVKYGLASRVSDVLFSPCFGEIEPRVLAEWILEDRLHVRFQLQQHKQLWADAQGR